MPVPKAFGAGIFLLWPKLEGHAPSCPKYFEPDGATLSELLNLFGFVYVSGLHSIPAMHPILRALPLLALCFCPLAHAADAPPGKPQYGAWGFDSSGADTSTKPGNDFFRYANGTWIDKTQIPPDKPAYSLRL